MKDGRYTMDHGKSRQGFRGWLAERSPWGRSPGFVLSGLRYRRWVGQAFWLLGLLFFWTMSAGANGVPVKLFLNYLPDISNWGPESAHGETTVAIGEGWVTMSVRELPQLQDGAYVVWLVTDQDVPIPIGKFNTDDAGSGDFEIRGLSLPQEPYKLILLTVEEDQDQYPFPGARRSLAGRFPDPELKVGLTPVPPPTPVESGGSVGPAPNADDVNPAPEKGLADLDPAPTQQAPVLLPVTGGVIVDRSPEPFPGTLALMSLSVLLVIGLVWLIASHHGGES